VCEDMLAGSSAGDTGAGMSDVREWRWANERGANGMPYPEELEYFGYQKVAQHPAYPSSWLMRRDG